MKNQSEEKPRNQETFVIGKFRIPLFSAANIDWIGVKKVRLA